MANKIKELFSPEEIRELTSKSDWQGAYAIARTWLLIGLGFALLAAFPNPLTFIVVVFFLGGQQLACAILTHEASHYTLFKTRALNDHLTDCLVARPMWTDVFRYRKHHMKHHSHTGTEQDPDTSLVTPFPTSRRSMFNKVLRDITGQTGLRRIVGLLAMDLGILKYSVSADVEYAEREGRRIQDYARDGLKNLGPVLISNAALFGILAACGAAWVYSAWVVAYLTSFSLFLRIRSIAEHACLPGGDDIFQNTRSCKAGWLAKLTVAPMNVNYHQEHHLMASVPFFRLRRMHQILIESGKIPPIAPSYAAVLRQASAAA